MTEYEVILPGLSRAERETADGVLYAAQQLVRDEADRGGSSALLRRELIVTKDGIYDGALTNAARAGRSGWDVRDARPGPVPSGTKEET